MGEADFNPFQTYVLSIHSRLVMARCYRMRCGLPKLEHEVRQGLTLCDLEVAAGAPKTLLLDAPRGWAPPQLRDVRPCEMVIVSDNPCAEYRLELLEHSPAALLSNVSIAEIAEHLKNPSDYRPPILASPLTPTERLTLRLLACGRSPKQIAQQRNVSEGGVKNTVGIIYQKLGLKSRAHLTLYYFGLWHVLEADGWKPLHPYT